MGSKYKGQIVIFSDGCGAEERIGGDSDDF
jgi:hypothetical protein